MNSAKIIPLLLGVLCFCVRSVSAQGGLIAPPGRSAMWAFLGNAEYAKDLKENKNYLTELNCGGRLVTPVTFSAECGPCGDAIDHNDPNAVRPNEAPGGKYAIGEVVAIYHEGDSINVTLDIASTENPGGYYQFSICETDQETKVSHDCFIHHLTWGFTTITTIPASRREGIASYNLKLPAGLTCEFCVLQWLWIDGADVCKPSGSTNCGRKTVANCADIRIIQKGEVIPPDFDWPRYDDYASINSATPAPTTISPANSVGGVPVISGGSLTGNAAKSAPKNTPLVSQSLVVNPVVPVAAGSAGAVGLATGNTGLGLFFILIAILFYLEMTNQPIGGLGRGALHYTGPSFAGTPFVHSPIAGLPLQHLPISNSFSTSSSFTSAFEVPGYNQFMAPTFRYSQNIQASPALPVNSLGYVPPVGVVSSLPSTTSLGNTRFRQSSASNIQPRLSMIGDIPSDRNVRFRMIQSARSTQPQFSSLERVQSRFSSFGTNVPLASPVFRNVQSSVGSISNALPIHNTRSFQQTGALAPRLLPLPTVRREFDRDPAVKRKQLPVPKETVITKTCHCKGRLLLFDIHCWHFNKDTQACNKQKDLCYCSPKKEIQRF